MRHEPCWTSFPYQVALSYGLTAVIVAAVFLVSECSSPAHAQVFVDAAAGWTRFIVTTPDGDYLQKSLPHTFDLNSGAYKIGAGYRFNERWSVSAAYINLGTVNQSAVFVPDEYYHAKSSTCINGCQGKANYRITDAYHGGQVTVSRSFQLAGDWAAHLTAGGALLMHRFTINRLDQGTSNEHYGRIPAAVVGAGLSYKWVYAELDWYKGFGGSNCYTPCGWPQSTEMVVGWAGIRIPIGG